MIATIPTLRARHVDDRADSTLQARLVHKDVDLGVHGRQTTCEDVLVLP